VLVIPAAAKQRESIRVVVATFIEDENPVPTVDDTLRDREAKAASRRLRAGRTIEATTDVRALFGWNTRARISDHDACIRLGLLNLHVDLRARRLYRMALSITFLLLHEFQ